MKMMTDICRCPELLPSDRTPVSVTLELFKPGISGEGGGTVRVCVHVK